MQRALLQYTDVTYEVCSTQDGVQYDVTRYASMTDLLSATEYSRDLLCLLRDNYMNWVLIPSELETLFIGYSEKGSIVVHGATSSLYDWLYAVTVDFPRKSRGLDVHEGMGSLLKNSSFDHMLAYLQDFCSALHHPDHQKLLPAQTDCGETYWIGYIPAKQD